MTPQAIRQAEATGAVFFNAELQAVQPKDGDWFCEFEWDTDYEGEDFVRDGELVEYVGEGRVLPEGADCDRAPETLVLIRQNY